MEECQKRTCATLSTHVTIVDSETGRNKCFCRHYCHIVTTSRLPSARGQNQMCDQCNCFALPTWNNQPIVAIFLLCFLPNIFGSCTYCAFNLEAIKPWQDFARRVLGEPSEFFWPNLGFRWQGLP